MMIFIVVNSSGQEIINLRDGDYLLILLHINIKCAK